MTRPIYEPTEQRQIRKLGFSADQLFRRPAPIAPDAGDSEGCLPPPGTIVRPTPLADGSLNTATYVNVRFPGGVIAAHLDEFLSGDASFTTSPTSARQGGPSGRTIGVEVADAGGGATYDDATDAFVFRPVDDFGCEAGVLYGIWFSFRYTDKGGNLHIESRSDNTVTNADTWDSGGGGRHNNATTTPSTLEWADSGDQTAEYPELPYYGMFPIGGQNNYGDWPLQGFGSSGLSFQAGETITVRAWTDSGTATVWLDHLVFIPTFPMGMGDPTDLDSETKNFSSSALEVLGYYEDPQPGSVTEPTDYGSIFGGASAVDDTQVLTRGLFDPDMHWTIASHDESDIAGLFTRAVGGGVHVYVLQRSNNSGGTYSVSDRGRGHVTVMSGTQPLSDIICQGAGAWTWAYGGKAPLGDGNQAVYGLIQWLGDDVVFWNNNDTDIDSVRSAFIAYVPQSPCEAIGFVTP